MPMITGLCVASDVLDYGIVTEIEEYFGAVLLQYFLIKLYLPLTLAGQLCNFRRKNYYTILKCDARSLRRHWDYSIFVFRVHLTFAGQWTEIFAREQARCFLHRIKDEQIIFEGKMVFILTYTFYDISKV
jgi:hypothetical protein